MNGNSATTIYFDKSFSIRILFLQKGKKYKHTYTSIFFYIRILFTAVFFNREFFLDDDYIQFPFNICRIQKHVHYMNSIGTLVANTRLNRNDEGRNVNGGFFDRVSASFRDVVGRETWTPLSFVSVPSWYCYKVVTS